MAFPEVLRWLRPQFPHAAVIRVGVCLALNASKLARLASRREQDLSVLRNVPD